MNLLIPAVTVRFLCDSQRKALLIKLLEIFFVSHLLTNFIHNHRLLNFQATKNDDELNWAFKSVSQILASSQISLCLWTIKLLIFQRISHFQLDIERVSITNFSEIDHHNTTHTHTGTHWDALCYASSGNIFFPITSINQMAKISHLFYYDSKMLTAYITNITSISGLPLITV